MYESCHSSRIIHSVVSYTQYSQSGFPRLGFLRTDSSNRRQLHLSTRSVNIFLVRRATGRHHVMAEAFSSYLSLGRYQLKRWRAKLQDLRNVKLVELGAVGVAGSRRANGMGFTSWEQLWWMLGAVCFFHTSEFLLALAYHGRRRVNAASTLISGPYLVALALSMVEHTLECRYVPWLKQQALVSYTGLAMVVVGEALRKLAVITANKSFTHDIKVDKRQEHKLVTHGIYSFFRHPGYLGFFIWSIGTQVLLVNPVCTVGYTIVTWRFFDHRIQYEEYFLRRFFGQDYVEYVSKVPSGMPFIK